MIRWKQNAVMATSRRALAAGVVAAAKFYEAELKRVVGKPGTDDTASRPGSPPERDEGGYQASIYTNLARIGEPNPAASVTSPGPKAAEFEFGTLDTAPRPHWIPTFNRLRGRMLQQASATIQREMARAK